MELDPGPVRKAREDAGTLGLADKVSFLEADAMDVSLADASVVLCYMSSSASAALKPKFESELKPGTRIVMEMFPVPGWKPARIYDIGARQFFMYVMPPEPGEPPYGPYSW